MKIVFGLLAVPVVGFLIIWMIMYLPMMEGFAKVSQMRSWEMPPETRVVRLEMDDSRVNGSHGWVLGELTIESQREWDYKELETFFNSRYYPEYHSHMNTILVESVDDGDETLFTYTVVAGVRAYMP